MCFSPFSWIRKQYLILSFNRRIFSCRIGETKIKDELMDFIGILSFSIHAFYFSYTFEPRRLMMGHSRHVIVAQKTNLFFLTL